MMPQGGWKQAASRAPAHSLGASRTPVGQDAPRVRKSPFWTLISIEDTKIAVPLSPVMRTSAGETLFGAESHFRGLARL